MDKEKTKGIQLGVRVAPEVARFIRFNRAETGETATKLIDRCLRREMSAARKREPAA